VKSHQQSQKPAAQTYVGVKKKQTGRKSNLNKIEEE